MSADPIPDGPVPLKNGKSAIFQSNARRIDVIFAFEFLEMQTRVSGIVSKNAISSFCVLLNVGRQIVERRVARDSIKADRPRVLSHHDHLLPTLRWPTP